MPDSSQPPSANLPISQGRFGLPMETGFQVPSALGRTSSLYISGALSKLGKAPFVASWMVLSKAGIVKTSLFCSILSNTLVENWATYFRIYRSNASLRHLPMIIIMSGVTPVSYITIEVPERMECAPISMGQMSNRPLPMIWTATRNVVQITAEVMANLFPFVSMKLLT